ncbi:unnamed protein product [Spirodela intermedia]|uniref:Serine-threonine/tyrosine-protein kinase catalytic domain-containing protein n=1 Tax=Spirodela intermedia TaxID=51605 RepID=A0ABN7EDF6_SPIIN|nr:unnamed protein product [Spirodela intermedia]
MFHYRYYQTSKLNEKSDIYSFGIVMLELITGKSPIIDGLEKISIVSWVQSRIEKGDIFQIVDQKLQGKYDINSVWKYIEIALSCASHYSTQRPSMSDVVMRLKECQSSISSNEIPRNYEDPTQSSTAMFHDSLFHGTNPSVR